VEVKHEVLIAVEDMSEVTEKGMKTEAIKHRHPRVLCEGEDPVGTSLLIRAMIQHPRCKINSEYRLLYYIRSVGFVLPIHVIHIKGF